MNSNWNPEMMKAFEMIMKIDPIFKKIFDQIGLPQNRTMKQGFQSLAKIIIGQQISTNVANTIYNKLIIDDILNENKITSLSIDKLKQYGLSSQKSYYLKNLAELIQKNELNLKTLNRLSSEEISNSLIRIKGVGKWTINNYKIFALQHIDAWPSADLALQEAIKIINKTKLRPTEKEMEELGNKWLPYRTAAALFLWHFYNKIKIEKLNLQI
jgi:DNA-3-methyladenine glycosylase II|tara:strand:+ start:67 stop:705 length:639 start_codon:yes stop_codon:yes gene_type:complete